MFVRTIVSLFACSILVFSEAAFVDTLIKCAANDEECLRKCLNSAFSTMSRQGAPELGINSVDPLELELQTIDIAGLLKLTLADGRVTGFSNCNVDRFAIYLDKGKVINQISCDSLVTEGKYHLDASNPIFVDILGSESVHGDGNGKVVAEKIVLKLEIPLSIVKREGEIYLKYDHDHLVYEYEILGKVKAFADNIIIGGQESSKDVLKLLNDNWKLIVNSFGKPIVEKALQIAFSVVSKFIDFVPAKQYITDDLSSYVKN